MIWRSGELHLDTGLLRTRCIEVAGLPKTRREGSFCIERNVPSFQDFPTLFVGTIKTVCANNPLQVFSEDAAGVTRASASACPRVCEETCPYAVLCVDE